MPSVRPVEPRDFAEVSRIMYASFQTFLGSRASYTPPEQWRSVNDETDSLIRRGFVAVEGDTILGFISVRADKVHRIGFLGSIGVDPNTFAHGIGTLLFREAEKFWNGQHVRKVTTCTSSINTRAQHYYYKMGFQLEGIRKDHFFPGVDELTLSIFYPDETVPVTVREMTEPDTADTCAVIHRAWTGVYKRRGLSAPRPETVEGEIRLVADEHSVSGVLTGSVSEHYGFADIAGLAVRPERGGRGIGSALLAEFEKRCIAKNIRKIAVTCPADDAAGVNFLVKHGYGIEETLKDHFFPGVDEHRMAKFLLFQP